MKRYQLRYNIEWNTVYSTDCIADAKDFLKSLMPIASIVIDSELNKIIATKI